MNVYIKDIESIFKGLYMLKIALKYLQLCHQFHSHHPTGTIFGKRQESFVLQGGCCKGNLCNAKELIQWSSTTSPQSTPLTVQVATSSTAQQITRKSTSNVVTSPADHITPNYVTTVTGKETTDPIGSYFVY